MNWLKTARFIPFNSFISFLMNIPENGLITLWGKAMINTPQKITSCQIQLNPGQKKSIAYTAITIYKTSHTILQQIKWTLPLKSSQTTCN